jgi:hypothetical protein
MAMPFHALTIYLYIYAGCHIASLEIPVTPPI